MYSELTNSDFLCLMIEKAHPRGNPSAEHADLMDEAARRIRKLERLVNDWESAADGAGAATPDELLNFIAACEVS